MTRFYLEFQKQGYWVPASFKNPRKNGGFADVHTAKAEALELVDDERPLWRVVEVTITIERTVVANLVREEQPT